MCYLHSLSVSPWGCECECPLHLFWTDNNARAELVVPSCAVPCYQVRVCKDCSTKGVFIEELVTNLFTVCFKTVLQ